MQSSITSYYVSHPKNRIVQGDIYKDFNFITINAKGEVVKYFFPYCILLSQDCDLENDPRAMITTPAEANTNSYLPNLLLAPAFLIDQVKAGTHLEAHFEIKQRVMNRDDIKKVRQNNDDRYHCIEFDQDLQVPELVIDFKHFFTVQMDFVKQNYNQLYLTTINELFRERLSQRFTAYLSRIGLPVIEKKTTTLAPIENMPTVEAATEPSTTAPEASAAPASASLIPKETKPSDTENKN